MLGLAEDGWGGAALDGDDPLATAEKGVARYVGHYIPVYSETTKVTSLDIRNAVELALDTVDRVREPVPEEICRRRRLMSRRAALELIHRPRLEDTPRLGVDRLRYDEAFVLQVILAQRRQAVEELVATSRVTRDDGLLAAFDARLPFTLTAGQREVGEVLAREMARSRPMHRLLQGEVGSGKTVVALRAMLAAVDAVDRPPCWHPPRSSRLNITVRSPRCSATSPREGCSAVAPSAPGSRCSPGV